VIWNGGDERFFFPRDRAAAREALGIAPDRFVVAFAGNLLRAKGIFDLIDAAAGIRAVRPLLVFAGEGNDERELRQRAERANVETRVLGHLDQPAVAQLYAAADTVTLPSYNEGMPNVVCEAMLSQRAVVASTAGGTPEIIENECTGLLVQPGNAEHLREALERVASNTELRDRLASQARDFASERLTWRVSARHYDRVLREAANVP
jgi:glycosyltransferase involved in cell wall biosynthesis